MESVEELSPLGRAKVAVASNVTLAIVACLVLAALGGYGAYQSFSGPDTTTEQRTVATWTANGTFTHGASVQRDTRAFEEGAVLQNRSVYFTSVTPILNGTYVVQHDGDADPATVETDLRLVVSAVELGEQESVLWEISEPVASERTESLDPGNRVGIPYEFNVTAQSELAERVRAELGSARGQVRVRLVADTRVSTTVAASAVERARTDVLTISPRPDTYGVTESTAEAEHETVTETVEVPVEPAPVSRYGSLLAFLVGLCGALGVAWLERTGRLDVDEQTRTVLRRHRERDSFDEWISTGRVPAVGSERVVTVDSLEGLVDVAIDSNRRVVEDAETETFVVLDDATRYEFRPERPGRLAQTGEQRSTDSTGQSTRGEPGDPLTNDADSVTSQDEE